MLKNIFFILLVVPGFVYAEGFSESELVGDWELLGNSIARVDNYNELTRLGPSINRFKRDGVYEYISVFQGKSSHPVIGSWRLQNNILSITRPDNGTFNNEIISYKNGVLETQETELETYLYMKKM